MAELLQQLKDRLKQLDCLAQPTKAFILDYAGRHFNEAQLRDYLDKTLGMVEGYNRLMGTEFHQSCTNWASSLNQAPSPQDGRHTVLQMLIIVLLRSMVIALPFCVLQTAIDVLWLNDGERLITWMKDYTVSFFIMVISFFIMAIWSHSKLRVVERKIEWLIAAAHHYSRDTLRCVYCLVNHFALPLGDDNTMWIVLDYEMRAKPKLRVVNRRIDAFVVGDSRRATKLIEFLYHDFGQPNSDTRPTVPQIRAIILSFFIITHGLPYASLALCRRLLPCLRQCIRHPNLSAEERRFFLEKITDLRHLVVEIGLCTTSVMTALKQDVLEGLDLRADELHRMLKQDEQLRLEMLCWDAELSQRLLLERYLLGHAFRAGDDGANTLDGYFLKDKPAFFDPPPNVNGGAPHANAVHHLGCFGMQEVPSVTLSSGAAQAEPTPPPKWISSVEEQLSKGIEAKHLADALTGQELLLMLAFTLDDRFLWTAFRRANDGNLEVAATNSRFGQPEDRDRVRWLTDWHDFLLDLTWAWIGRRNDSGACNHIREYVQSIHKMLRDRTDLGELPGVVKDLCCVLCGNAQPAELEDRGRRLLTLPEDRAAWPEWSQTAAARWQYVAALPCQPADQQMETALDMQTTAYLEEVNKIVDLNGLQSLLDPDKTDLVVQATDMLHAVPAAYLHVDGQPLFKKVHSIRAVMSLTLTDLQRRAENEAVAQHGSDPRHVLTASWFKQSDDSPRRASYDLHLKMKELAKQSKLSWFSVAEKPEAEATPTNLVRGLKKHGPFRVGVSCQHGGSAGVVLCADPPRPPDETSWRGEGADLSVIEFLLFVSCVVGRLRQESGRDVEGFCIDLVLNQARSVLAARWPIHCWQAPNFALAVVRHYLELRTTEEPTPETCLRARALNLARHDCFDRKSLTVGLNTAAAFELYGLG